MAKGPQTQTVTPQADAPAQNTNASGAAFPSVDQANVLKSLPMFLSAEVGGPLVQAGWAIADTANVNEANEAMVSISEAGQALLDTPAQTVTPRTPSPAVVVSTVRNDIPMPSKKGRGRTGGSKYPIDTMGIGESFHVAPTDPNDDPVGRMASTIANSRLKFAIGLTNEDGSPKMVEKVTHTYQKGPDGKLAKGPDNKRIVATSETISVQETKLGRDWMTAAVDASDPDGKGARVWRTL
jgi:hypothetical protein